MYECKIRRVEYPFLNNLLPHPLNPKIYGNEQPSQKLIKSIRESGLLTPLLVDKNRRILSGHRRWKAFSVLYQKENPQIPVMYFRGSEIEAEQAIIECNRQRDKTAEQKAREYKELKRIETELAKQRQIAAQDNKRGRAVKENVPEQTKGQARDKAAEAIGISAPTAEHLLKITENNRRG